MMNYQKIKRLQSEHGVSRIQELINNGQVWHFEGSLGRYASGLLKSGVCMLPKARHRDHYGNIVPGRDDVKSGTTGSYQKCRDFWARVESGELGFYFEDNEDSTNHIISCALRLALATI